MKRRIDYIVLHCTGTRDNASVLGIKTHWKRNLKWDRVGYHWIVEADGKATRLSEDEDYTYGVKGFNLNSIHICYIGGTDENGVQTADTRTDAQKETLERLVKEYNALFTKAQILGHKDFKGVRKTCPNFNVKAWVAEIFKK